MTAYEYSYTKKLWSKRCSDCKRIYQGEAEEANIVESIHQHFHFNRHMTDGFLSYCVTCQHDRIRRGNGIKGQYNVEEIFTAQQGKCAICQISIKFNQGRGCGAQLDHDHATGKIRGLLCPLCNRGLGKFKDSISNLEAAIAYLKQHL